MGCAWFVLEAMARASALRKLGYFGGDEHDAKAGEASPQSQLVKDGPDKNDEIKYGALDQQAQGAELGKSVQTKGTIKALHYPLSISNHRFEMVELCEVFLGQSGKLMYLFLVGVYMYGSMWAYSAVFANSWAKAFPLGDLSFESSYNMYLLLWAFVEIPWSSCELDEQIMVQVLLTMGRIVLVFIMCTTVLICDYNHENAFLLQSGGHNPQGLSGSTVGGKFQDFNIANIHIIMAISIYANNLHHSINTLVQPMMDKKKAGLLFFVSFSISTVAYVLLGCTLATYFGSYSPSSSNLSWANYVGFSPTEGYFLTGSVPVYARVIGLFVLLFPSLDVASTFPLLAVTFGNNLMAVWYQDSAQALQLARVHYPTLVLFRCIASVPPIVGAYCVSNLGSVTAYTGLTGVFISITLPALLSYTSKHAIERRGISSDTLWTHSYSNALNSTVAVLSVVVASYILFKLLTTGVPSGLK